MNDTFGLDELRSELVQDEGSRNVAYLDTRGNITAGIGHNLSAHAISDAIIQQWFADDIDLAAQTLDDEVPWWRTLPPNAQRVMVNLCFNMGWGTLKQFQHFLDAMQAQDWQRAADELQASAWWHEVGERGPRMIARLLGTSTSTTA